MTLTPLQVLGCFVAAFVGSFLAVQVFGWMQRRK